MESDAVRAEEFSAAFHPHGDRRGPWLKSDEHAEILTDVTRTRDALRAAGVDWVDALGLSNDIVRRRVGVAAWSRYRSAEKADARRLKARQGNGAPIKPRTRRRSRFATSAVPVDSDG